MNFNSGRASNGTVIFPFDLAQYGNRPATVELPIDSSGYDVQKWFDTKQKHWFFRKLCMFQITNLNLYHCENSAECCVCYNPTKYQTTCEHSICLKCYPNILLKQHGEAEIVLCPLCRCCLVEYIEDSMFKYRRKDR
jgi:hypothetical protein